VDRDRVVDPRDRRAAVRAGGHRTVGELLHHLEQVPVLVLSAAAAPTTIDVRFDGFLSKPFDLDDFLKTVGGILERHG